MALKSAEIRQQFIDYFEQRHKHVFAPSSPVVPHDDPTLLFTNAGMNQFKPVFLGQVDPGSDMGRLSRAVNSQKCIRAGGKHNDLDDVGKDLYHHTFFEMLGNWSFGDYFKDEAIRWAWELLTEVWGLDPDRMYATYFEGDKAQGLDADREAYDLWTKHLPAQRVLPGDTKDNFWEMGETGPCGPCSEIHYDGRSDDERAREPGYNLVNRDHPDVIEVWNLVFIQFNRTESGLAPLPAKHVDTGMGFERITRILQNKTSNYDTDIFTPLFERIRNVCNAPDYGGSLESGSDMAYRVIADHIRTLVFAITDGAEPSNEGRGYVLRRILRRAVRHGRQTLGAEGPFLCNIAPTVVETMGDFFPELKKNPERVEQIIRDEEEAFGRTIDRGIALFERSAIESWARTPLKPEVQENGSVARAINYANRPHLYVGHPDNLKEPVNGLIWSLDDLVLAGPRDYFAELPKPISAEDAFKLHDTYGFPIDLTQVMAEERGMTVDVTGFERLMEEARERARSGGAKGAGEHPAATLPGDAVARLKGLGVKPTDDEPKFELKGLRARLRAIWNGYDFDENVHAANTGPEDRFALIFDRTNCYAEMGGQVGDTGLVTLVSEARTNVRDSATGGEFRIENTKSFGGYVVHLGRVVKGEMRVGDNVFIELERPRRRGIMSNHTATHLLNLGLRRVLGETVDQKGSLVAPDRLRFDFNHRAAVTAEEMIAVEDIVRTQINEDLPVCADTAPLKLAKRINGLRAVFGEVYPDPVRVVSIGAPVSALVQDPESEQWRDLSIEFCGGTHVERTSEIEAFAIIEETAVSKGVRRISALTGKPAESALAASKALEGRIEQAQSLEGDALESELASIGEMIEGETLPVAARRRIAGRIESLARKARQAAKAAAKEDRAAAVDAARRIADTASGPVIVEPLPGAGGDRQALLSALDSIRARHESSAVMLLGVDDAEGKIAIVANVPKAMIERGLKAGDWVRAAAEACGGKGGGRPDSAQGGGTDVSKVDAALEAARDFAGAKAG